MSKYDGVFKRYGEHSPTPFDRNINIDDDETERSQWFIMPVTQNRDSQCLDQSNFAAFLKGLGGESESVEVHRFGHWGPGWYEIIIVHPDSPVLDEAYGMSRALGDCPVLDEEDNNRRESEEAEETWDNHACGEFRKACINTLEGSLDEADDSEPADPTQRWCKHWGLSIDICGCGDCIETQTEWVTGLVEFVDELESGELRGMGEDHFGLTWEMHSDGVYYSWNKEIDVQVLCDALEAIKEKTAKQAQAG